MNLKEIPLKSLKEDPKKYANEFTINDLLDALNICIRSGDEERKEIIKRILELKGEEVHEKPELEFGGDINETINGDFDTALDYLAKYCRDTDDRFEWYGKPFNKVTIRLPKTNGFNGKELTFYVETGDGCCNGKDFKENNCKEYSFSRNDITNILNSVKNFLISVGVNPYEKVDKFDEKHEIDRSKICINHLLGLEENETVFDSKGHYRLKDKLFGFSPDYYQLVSKKNGLEFERGLYDYGEGGMNDIGKLLLKSRPNKENKK